MRRRLVAALALLGATVVAVDVLVLLARDTAPAAPREWLAAVVLALAFALVALTVVGRDPRRRTGLLAGGLLLGLGLALGQLLLDLPAVPSLGRALHTVGLVGVCLLALWYPDGWLPRAWGRAAAVPAGLAGVLVVVAGLVGTSALRWAPMLAVPLAVAGLVGHWTESSAARRRVIVAFGVPAVAFPLALAAVPDSTAGTVGLGLGALLFPVAMAYGVLRYRLYTADRPVARVTAYVLATLVLLGAYVGLLTLVGAVATVPRSLAVGVAVLATAVLFGPLRRAIRGLLLRLFARSRRLGEQAVDAFAVRLREEVTVAEVHADLVTTVGRLVQPSHVAVWLAEPPSHRR